jgi:hypothetical protein
VDTIVAVLDVFNAREQAGLVWLLAIIAYGAREAVTSRHRSRASFVPSSNGSCS